MADLEGKTISATYRSVLNVGTANNQELDGTLRVIEDGAGNDSVLYLATDSALIKGDENKLYFYDADGGEHISGDSSGRLLLRGAVEIDLTTALVDINSTGGVTIDGTSISIDGTDDSNLTVTGSNKDLTIAVAGGSTQTLTLNSAGTSATAIGINASAGGVSVGLGGGAGDDFNIDSDTFVVESDTNLVGIGESDPLAKLHVKTSDAGAMPGDGSLDSDYDDFAIESSGNTGMTILSGTSGYGSIVFADSGDVDVGRIKYFHASTNALQFFTNGSADVNMTLDGSGNLGIATAAFSSGAKCIGLLNGTDPGGTTTNTACLLSLSGEMNYTDADGNIATLSSLSDERTKDNITVIPDALSRLAKLKGVTFNYVSYKNSSLPFKDDIADDVTYAPHDKYGNNTRVGVIAQDVNEAYDGLNVTNAVENLSVESMVQEKVEDHVQEIYGKVLKTRESTLIPLLIEAVKELSAKVEALENA